MQAKMITMELEQNGKGKSAYKGVYMCGRRWKAQIQIKGTQFYLGTFDTEQEAAQAYEIKARAVRRAKENGGAVDEREGSPSSSPAAHPISATYMSAVQHIQSVQLPPPPAQQQQQQQQQTTDALLNGSLLLSSSTASAMELDGGRANKRVRRAYQSSIPLRPEDEAVFNNPIPRPSFMPPSMSMYGAMQSSDYFNGQRNSATYAHVDAMGYGNVNETAENHGIDGVDAADIESFPSTTPCVLNDMWARYIQVSQRLIIAQSAAESLGKLQVARPHKDQAILLNNLQGEQLMLGVIREHLQRAISRVIDPVESLRRIQPQQPQTSQIASRVKYYNSIANDLENGATTTSNSNSSLSSVAAQTADAATRNANGSPATTKPNSAHGENSPLHLLCGAAVAVAAAREQNDSSRNSHNNRNESPLAAGLASSSSSDAAVEMQTMSDLADSTSTEGHISVQNDAAQSETFSDADDLNNDDNDDDGAVEV